MNRNQHDADRKREDKARPAVPAGTRATASETRPTEATQDRPAIEAFDAEGAGVAAKE